MWLLARFEVRKSNVKIDLSLEHVCTNASSLMSMHRPVIFLECSTNCPSNFCDLSNQQRSAPSSPVLKSVSAVASRHVTAPRCASAICHTGDPSAAA